MARRSNLDGLIHCQACGEDYSATYKRCPFCGQPPQGGRMAQPSREFRSSLPDSEEDEYVFDGQGAFDDTPEPVRPARPKGGKRLAPSGSPRRIPSNPAGGDHASPGGRRPPEPINWPRLITFLCSLVIIAATLVIVFTVIYPQLRQQPNPVPSQSQSASQAPSPSPQTSVLTSLSLSPQSLTLASGERRQLVLSLSPADWVGTPVWTSSDVTCATVDSVGRVTNMNTSSADRQVTITVTAGSLSAQCTITCEGAAPVTTRPPAASQPPVSSRPPASSAPSGGEVGLGSATVANADGGVRVRSGPGTSYDILASLFNGNPITVVSDAGGGWYEITFSGVDGGQVTGYLMGEYISRS